MFVVTFLSPCVAAFRSDENSQTRIALNICSREMAFTDNTDLVS